MCRSGAPGHRGSRAHARVRRPLPRPAGGDLADRGHRARGAQDRRAAGAHQVSVREHARERGHRGHESKHRRRGHGDVSGAPARPPRDRRDAPCERSPRGGRSGVCRRGDVGPRARGSPADRVLTAQPFPKGGSVRLSRDQWEFGTLWRMALIVQKYGGSSIGDADRIRRVARRVVAAADSGQRVCVVVSAMGHTTDELLDLAAQISPAPHERELDMLLTAGERISMALLSMAIMELERNAISFTGSQAGIVTDTAHGKARILDVRARRVLDALESGRIAIVAGYQGVSTAYDITTLG